MDIFLIKKTFCKRGIYKTRCNRKVPIKKARILCLFENNPIWSMDFSFRLLKPWSKRDKQIVTKAKVEAASVFIFKPQ